MKSIKHSKRDTTSWTENVGVLWEATAGTPHQVRLACLLPGRALSSSRLSVHRTELFFPKCSNIATGTNLQNQNQKMQKLFFFVLDFGCKGWKSQNDSDLNVIDYLSFNKGQR